MGPRQTTIDHGLKLQVSAQPDQSVTHTFVLPFTNTESGSSTNPSNTLSDTNTFDATMADQLTPFADKSVRARRVEKCGPLMEALEKCHARGWLSSMLGSCNKEAARMAECFHEEVTFAISLHGASGKKKKKENRKERENDERWQELTQLGCAAYGTDTQPSRQVAQGIG